MKIQPAALSFNQRDSTTTMLRALKCIVPLLGFALLSAACVYRLNIQQGNFLDQAAVDQVKPGMTHSQVRYLLGTPMVADTFDKERWDYIYYLKKGRTRKVDSRRVTVFFDGEKVAKIDKPSAAVTAAQDASAAAMKPERRYQ
ncbi:MAG: outer membrane protein assembly factor BamE [Steroidobacteraceae bacterium]|nr:outer membrane protein assembly factor BamE [Pseudomonadota bacterium]